MKTQKEIPLNRDPDLSIISEELKVIVKTILGKMENAPEKLSGYELIAKELQTELNTYLSYRAAEGLKAHRRTRRLTPKKNRAPAPVIDIPELIAIERNLVMMFDFVIGCDFNIPHRQFRYERITGDLKFHINDYLENRVIKSFKYTPIGKTREHW